MGGTGWYGKDKMMKLKNIRGKAFKFMDKINHWVQKKL